MPWDVVHTDPGLPVNRAPMDALNESALAEGGLNGGRLNDQPMAGLFKGDPGLAVFTKHA